jgi:hypothetical protein
MSHWWWLLIILGGVVGALLTWAAFSETPRPRDDEDFWELFI